MSSEHKNKPDVVGSGLTHFTRTDRFALYREYVFGPFDQKGSNYLGNLVPKIMNISFIYM